MRFRGLYANTTPPRARKSASSSDCAIGVCSVAATECPRCSASIANSFHISSLPAHEQSPTVEIMPIGIRSLILRQDSQTYCEFGAQELLPKFLLQILRW